MINIKTFLKNIFKTRKLTAIKFHAWMPNGSLKSTEFKLGLGPCGKVVTKLEARGTPLGGLVVFQTTDDKEVKTFYYPLGSTAGRIERTYN